MVTVALYGQPPPSSRCRRSWFPVVGALMVIGVIAFAAGFQPARPPANTRWAGSPTWTLCAVLFAAAPISLRAHHR